MRMIQKTCESCLTLFSTNRDLDIRLCVNCRKKLNSRLRTGCNENHQRLPIGNYCVIGGPNDRFMWRVFNSRELNSLMNEDVIPIGTILEDMRGFEWTITFRGSKLEASRV